MKIKKIFFILLFPFLAEIVVSCCNCDESIVHKITHCDLTVDNLESFNGIFAVSSSTSIPKDAFGLRMSILRRENQCRRDEFNSVFISSSYAKGVCDCPPPNQYLLLENVTAVRIISLNDFDSEHAAGSDVSEYFRVTRIHDSYTITEYLERINSPEQDFSNPVKEIDLFLTTPPTLGKAHQFRIILEMSDGENFESHSTLVDLI